MDTVTKGKNSISYFGSVSWNSIAANIRYTEVFEGFKSEIRKWKPINCSSQLGKNYIQNPIYIFIAYTQKYLQSDWLREVQYGPYLYSVFNICTL